jgi:hypothetical protein
VGFQPTIEEQLKASQFLADSRAVDLARVKTVLFEVETRNAIYEESLRLILLTSQEYDTHARSLGILEDGIEGQITVIARSALEGRRTVTMHRNGTSNGPSCANCKFWKRIEGSDEGMCRRDPPTIQPDIITRFPITQLDVWCGEHEVRDPLLGEDPMVQNALRPRPPVALPVNKPNARPTPRPREESQ